MRVKKILSILLVALLLFSSMTACAKSNSDETKVPTESTEIVETNPTEEVDEVPESTESLPTEEVDTEIETTVPEETEEVTIPDEETPKGDAPNISNTEKEDSVKPVETQPTEAMPSEPSETKPVEKPTEPEEVKPIKPVYKEVDETVYAKSTVNVRKGPSTDYDKVGSLSTGDSVKRIGIGDNGWSKVIYKDEERFVHNDYLTTTKPVVATYPMTYSDSTATITIYKEWYENAYCYAAHIQFTDYSRLGTNCANASYNNGYETTSHAANRLGAILAINGCYSSPNLGYTVVRDGVIWNGAEKSTWLPAIYSKHNGLFLSAWESGGTPGIAGKNVQELVDGGLFTDSFCFGPPILSGGEIKAGSDTSRAQRTFMGTNGDAGDVWLVVSDGRYNDGKSAGLTYREMAAYLQSKGCTFGVPLDGGGSSTMVFQGKVLNAANGNQRAVVDFVYFK